MAKAFESFREFKFEEKIGKDSHEVLKLKRDDACDHRHGSK